MPVRAPDAYAPLAAAYGTLTAAYDYDRWLGVIEELAATAAPAGFTGRRVLDIACGTGSSFLPLLDRGRYEVTGCDLSGAMLEIAARRAADHPVQLLEHDMRELPTLGEFDLVLCLDDSLNHLLEAGEVEQALHGIARNLAADGVAVFDVNTLGAMRAAFAADRVVEDDRHIVLWRGQEPKVAPGGLATALIDVLASEDGVYVRDRAAIVERHHPVWEVEAMLRPAGLELVRSYGQTAGARMHAGAVDEDRHDKALFVARRG